MLCYSSPPSPSPKAPPDTDTAEFTRLEAVWNSAHLNSDADALDKLQADDLEVILPRVAVIPKNDALQFFRSSRFKFQKYETPDLHIRTYGNSAVITGALLRVRTVNGNTVTDNWALHQDLRKEWR